MENFPIPEYLYGLYGLYGMFWKITNRNLWRKKHNNLICIGLISLRVSLQSILYYFFYSSHSSAIILYCLELCIQNIYTFNVTKKTAALLDA